MKLDIVVPAYNEEEAIQDIIERCLGARDEILRQTPLDEVTITVVSDGSHDRTEEIARAFEPRIQLVAWPRNRGYGAAIKAGFAANNGDLVGFLDADGTCDPRFFGPLVREILDKDASISLGSRMSAKSRMPPIRRLGNRIWRAIINWIAQTDITDVASGMRVIRREVLPLLGPLPDGLHYTPTMSCRAALDARLSIAEIPMDYRERIGRSKLSVVRDGLRFLHTILSVGLTYQPFRLISQPGILLLLLSMAVALPVVRYYARNHVIEEGDIYRILTSVVLALGGWQFFLSGLAAERAVAIFLPKKWGGGRVLAILQRVVNPLTLTATAIPLLAMALALNGEGLGTWITEGYVGQHWSRAMAGALCVLLAFQCLAGALLDGLLRLVQRALPSTPWRHVP